MFSFDSVAFIALFLHSLFLSLPVSALPHQIRQVNDQPKTVTTVTTAESSLGPVTVTCTLVFTPIKDAQGRDAVQEVKTCILSVNGSQESSGAGPPTSMSIISSLTATVTTATTENSIASSTTTSTLTSNTPGTTSSQNNIIGTSITTITSPTITSTSQPSPFDASIQSSTTPAVQPSAAGATADSSMPGKQLSVLPIGLGVFAGISVIALIVVGLVTYERTKYRKAFRQRKLAEAGAAMGYGGMGIKTTAL